MSDGDADALRTLLAEGAGVDDRAGGGQTALMLAAIFGHVEIVRLLIAAGADVRLQDNLGLTAGEWAARRGHSEIAESLSNGSPGEVRHFPKSATSEPICSNGAGGHDPLAEAKHPSEQNAHSGTEDQPRRILDPQSEEHRERSSFAIEPKDAKQDDGLRWIKFQKRLIADSERRKAQEELQAAATEMRTESLNDAPSPTEEQSKTPTEQELREEEQEHWESLIELKISPEQEGPTETDDHSRMKSQPERRAEQERPAVPQTQAISPGLDLRRVLEESRKGVEAEDFSKPRESARAATDPEERSANGKALGSGPGVSVWSADSSEVYVNGERYTRRERLFAEQSLAPAILESKTSQSTPFKRCPRCDLGFEDPLLSYCAYDGTKLVSANDFDSSAGRDRTPPTIWALVVVMAVLGGFVGYQMNNYLGQERGSSDPPAAAQTEQPANLSKDLPTIEGALIGMEIHLPEPDYPEQARIDGVTGSVSVRVQVNKTGRVISARSSSGDWRLRAAAVRAAQKATFSPEKLAGRGASGTITYVFSL